MKSGISFILIATVLTGCFLPRKSTVKNNPDRFVFWVSVNASIKISNETKKEVYVIRTSRNKPYSGKIRKYQRFLHKSLIAGHSIPIGPFDNYEDAARAADYYKLTKFNSKTMEKSIGQMPDSIMNEEYYWFFLKFSYSQRKRTIYLKRTAARVASGNLRDFRSVLWEGRSFKKLAAGPFISQEEAEEAKRLYRLEE